MIRQRDNVAIYRVFSEKSGTLYFVELLRLQNNYYGNPRFEAHIIRPDNVNKYGYCGAHVFRFTGHYLGDDVEAKWIIDYFEKKLEKLHNN